MGKKKRILKKGDKHMMNFTDFIKANKDKIYQMADANTPKNEYNVPMITKEDSWRDEMEWDVDYEERY